MTTVTVKAPGKLMIMGEHAVVYGYPCIVTAIDRYLTVEAELINNREDQLITPDVSDQRFLQESIRVFKKAYQIGKQVKLTTKSELGKYGLGSSAATVVVTLKALSLLFDAEITDEKLFDIGLQTIISVQGKASGFDIAASIAGGTIYFDGKTKEWEKITSEPLSVVVGFSGVKADTVSMVQMVNDKRKNFRKGIDTIFGQIEKLVLEARTAIGEKDWKRVGTLMNYNQNYLEDLGVSTQKLNALISAAIKAGAFGAKLSGAGGGDCMIALVPMGKKVEIAKSIQESGGEIIDIQSNAHGVSDVTMF